eukprot:SAG11_NODE_28860_length_317_cov_0.697248_1_plen_46_part_10
MSSEPLNPRSVRSEPIQDRRPSAGVISQAAEPTGGASPILTTGPVG